MPQSKRQLFGLIALVFWVVPLSGICLDVYTPSLPAVTAYFGTTHSAVQLTVTAYLVGLGIVQLLAGSVSDSFGRAKPFTFAMLAYIVVTFLIPFVTTIYLLIALRFLQGAVLAMVVVPMRSVFVDLFEGPVFHKMITYLTVAWSMGPIIAPALGGYLQQYVGWKANFYFLGLYGVIAFLLARVFLFETSEHRYPFHTKAIIHRYRSMLCDPIYLTGILTAGVLFSFISLFGIAGPFFIQSLLHYTAAEYGYFALLFGAAWFSGASFNRFILHVALARKATYTLFGMLVVALVMLACALTMPFSVYLFVIPMMALIFGCSLLYPSYFIRCVMLYQKTSGSANALFNSSTFFLSGLISGLATNLHLKTPIPFILLLIGLIGIALLLHSFSLIAEKNREKSIQNGAATAQ